MTLCQRSALRLTNINNNQKKILSLEIKSIKCVYYHCQDIIIDYPVLATVYPLRVEQQQRMLVMQERMPEQQL